MTAASTPRKKAVEIAARAEIAHDYSVSKILSEEEKQKLIDVHWPKYIPRVTAVLAALQSEPPVDRDAVLEEAAKLVEEPASPSEYPRYQYPAQNDAAERHRYEKHANSLLGQRAKAIRALQTGGQS